MLQYIKNKTLIPILDFLKQGISPPSLAFAIAMGFAIGTFPVIGVTTIICAMLSVIFKLNMVVIQLVNYFVYPLQLLLIIPLIKTGSKILGFEGFDYSANEFFLKMKTDLFATIKNLVYINSLGILAWFLFIVPLAIILFYFIKSYLYKIKFKY